MATETFKYFQPTTAYLRTDYAPANTTIQNFGDSVEVYPATLTMRHIATKLLLPKSGTDRLCIQGQTTTLFSGNGVLTAFTLPFTPISKEALAIKIGSTTQAPST